MLYALSVENTEIQDLQKKIVELGLYRTYNFFPDYTLGRIIAGIVSFMYLFNIAILVQDGATDSNITKLFTALLLKTVENDNLRDRIGRGQNLIKKAFDPIKRYGIIILPIWIMVMALLPLYFIVLYIYNSPLVKIILDAFQRLIERWCRFKDSSYSEEKLFTFCEIFWFSITMIFVFVVWALGINFLIYLSALILIKMLINKTFVYQIIPVLILLLFYLRDSFKDIIRRYANHKHQIMNILEKMERHDLEKIRSDSSQKYENQMFQFHSLIEFSNRHNVPPDFNRLSTPNENSNSTANDRKEFHRESTTLIELEDENTNMFVVRFGHVKMRLQHVFVFFSKSHKLQISKNFLFHTSTMNIIGAPGPLAENYIRVSIAFSIVARSKIANT